MLRVEGRAAREAVVREEEGQRTRQRIKVSITHLVVGRLKQKRVRRRAKRSSRVGGLAGNRERRGEVGCSGVDPESVAICAARSVCVPALRGE